MIFFLTYYKFTRFFPCGQHDNQVQAEIIIVTDEVHRTNNATSTFTNIFKIELYKQFGR